MEKSDRLPARISTALLLLRIASYGVSLSWKRHPLRELWRPGPSAVCCIASLASCHGISDRAGTVGWRSGCAKWDFVSTWSCMHRGCDAGSGLFHSGRVSCPGPSFLLRVFGVEDFEPSAVLSLRDVRPELLLGNDALQVQFA